jgi:hypothetical protein
VEASLWQRTGQSGLHFMKSWSEISRGLQISLLPDLRRELVKPRKSPVSNNPFKASVIHVCAGTLLDTFLQPSLFANNAKPGISLAGVLFR